MIRLLLAIAFHFSSSRQGESTANLQRVFVGHFLSFEHSLLSENEKDEDELSFTDLGIHSDPNTAHGGPPKDARRDE